MREIKFRAWDKKYKRFGYIHLHLTSIHWPASNYMRQNLIVGGPNKEPQGISIKDIEGFQQYTGLKDKNGKEIYEFDYVIGQTYDKSVEIKGKVFYDQGAFSVWQNEGYQPPLYDVIDIEIIGNVFENPELLDD